MPELPEVETIRRGIEPHVCGQRISRVIVRERRLRWPIPAGLEQKLAGRRIERAGRRAKYIVLELDSGDRLLVHLGMSGKLRLLPGPTPLIKHDHVDIMLADGKLLRFNDPRRFGALLWWKAGDDSHELLAHLGPEPFDSAFNGDYLFTRSRGRTAAIKNFIMDGQIVVGAGNIYASEALFHCGIRPGRAAGRVTRTQFQLLATHIQDVLRQAIVRGGTTLRDYVGAGGEAGYFQQELYVYGRHGQACRTCAHEIKRQIIGQRSSFYCPHCQS